MTNKTPRTSRPGTLLHKCAGLTAGQLKDPAASPVTDARAALPALAEMAPPADARAG